MFERFDPIRHGPDLVDWYKGRGLLVDDEIDLSLFPTTGFIVDGILASFLYLTNSSLAYVDNTVADPRSSKEERRTAAREMLPLLEEEARAYGAKALCTSVYMRSLAALLTENSYVALPEPHTVYLRRL